MSDSGGRLVEPKIWMDALPEDVFIGLRSWAAAQPLEIGHVRRLTKGRSGSYIAVVRIRPEHGRLHQAVLKVLPPAIGIEESRGVQLAEQWTPQKFWDEHMVPTTGITVLPGTDWWVHTQKLAHANLTQMCPLAELVDEPYFADFCGTILGTIIKDWHRSDDPKPHKHTVHSFLSEFLDRHQQGLAEFADSGGIDIENPSSTVHTQGRSAPLPNPLALLTGVAPRERIDDPVEIYVANGHGDFQLFNVLVPAEGPMRAAGFRVIDYGRFSPETPVSRDPVKLLLSVAAAWLPELPGAVLRSRLAELIVSPLQDTCAGPMAGYQTVARRIYEAASGWGTQRHMPEEWGRQHLIVLMGSALRAVADTELDIADRWWFFEVAALATRAYKERKTTRAQR